MTRPQRALQYSPEHQRRADPQHQSRQREVPEGVDDDVEAQAEQTVDRRRARSGHSVRAMTRRESPSVREQVQLRVQEHQREQPEQERRDRGAGDHHEPQRRRAAHRRRAEQPHREAEHEHHDQRGEHQLYRGRDRPPEVVGDGVARVDRHPQVPANRVAEVVDVLGEDRLVEPEPLAFKRNQLRGRARVRPEYAPDSVGITVRIKNTMVTRTQTIATSASRRSAMKRATAQRLLSAAKLTIQMYDRDVLESRQRSAGDHDILGVVDRQDVRILAGSLAHLGVKPVRLR